MAVRTRRLAVASLALALPLLSATAGPAQAAVHRQTDPVHT